MNRRSFLQNTAIAGAGSLLVPGFLSSQGRYGAPAPFGIQVYSVKNEMAADPKGTLKALVADGYKTIESFEGDKGFFWGMKPLEFKKYLGDMDATCRSTHANISDKLEEKVSMAAEAGLSYLICPWKGPQKSIDDFKRFADEFNRAGELCKKAGIRFAYHNHDYSFKELEGQLPQHVMLKNTDPALVDFEMDIYWVVTAGKDPVAEASAFPNRYRLCHVKQKENDKSSLLRSGEIDFAAVLPALAAQGMRYNIVEQEHFDATTPMEAAKLNAAFMRNLMMKGNPATRKPATRRKS